MAAAVHFPVPLSTVEFAVQVINFDDINQAAVPCDAGKIDRDLVGRLQNQINKMGILYKALVETHKDRLRINRMDDDFSSFGLDRYTEHSFARFQSEFKAVSSDWPLDWRNLAGANRDPPAGWLSNYIRNSDAHNSTRIQWHEGSLGVFMSNSQERTITNFECWMPVKYYLKLLANSSKYHIDECKICRGFIEDPWEASKKLKLLKDWVMGRRDSEKAQPKNAIHLGL
ncbi:hypothetical protein PENSTE_c019G08440 [Penicillium steckii]|uniref:Uncharacterized protein n=1 Tax=Penicillium steckii TaxID=303698 RepID=A0A1V6SVS6_9EURO|nr:hypothetical protein PENSTE_c019G08440 [Penicillium steckii]